MKIQVTTPCCDDIGNVLKSMNLPFEQYNVKNRIDCDILFLTCLTPDNINQTELKSFVEKGGILYASDLTSDIITVTFPNTIIFEGGGKVCKLQTEITDNRLIQYIGMSIEIIFDMTAWAMIERIITGKVLMKRKDTGKPIMVEIPYGKGRIFYTSFHNNAQSSEKEMALLKILVLTQYSEKQNISIDKVANKIGFDLKDIQDKYGKKGMTLTDESQNKLLSSNVDNIISKFDKQNNYQKETKSLPDVSSTIDKF